MTWAHFFVVFRHNWVYTTLPSPVTFQRPDKQKSLLCVVLGIYWIIYCAYRKVEEAWNYWKQYTLIWVVQDLWWLSHSESPASGDTQPMHSHHAEPNHPTQGYQIVAIAAIRLLLYTHQRWEATCSADDTTVSPLSSWMIRTKAMWCPEGFQLAAAHTCFLNQGWSSSHMLIIPDGRATGTFSWQCTRHLFTSVQT